MRYESLLASRYIKAQKRQSVFTAVSIAAAVAVITMIFILYSVCMNCLEKTFYSSTPYHLVFSELTEEQGEAMADFDEVRSVKLTRTEDGVSAEVLFSSDIGDREVWLCNAARQIGASQQYERSKHNSMHGAYQWNNTLMMLDGVYDGAHLFRLRIFCIFFIFAVLIAIALRLIIDTAFEVSSKERERHYGVLQSIGATPEQIVRIITYEGLRLCAVGVPFGLLAGIGLACLMYNVLLSAGLSEIFQGMTNAKLYLPFSVDWRMLLISAAVGIVWVFLSAYGVGMRIIKKTPMEAIITRTAKVEKVKRRTLSGLLFGISGSIASRNARRQKKRFAVTVLTLTVSITLFALFSTLTETVERSIANSLPVILFGCSEEAAAYIDFDLEIGNPANGISYTEAEAALEESGLFDHIVVSREESFQSETFREKVLVYYVNREGYTRIFGADPSVSYDDLVTSGGYVYNLECTDHKKYAEKYQNAPVPLTSTYMAMPEDADPANMSYGERVRNAVKEKKEHTLDIIGSVTPERFYDKQFFLLIGAIETHEQIEDEWFGDINGFASAEVALIKNGTGECHYNATDLKKAEDWFMEHSELFYSESEDVISINFYSMKWGTHCIMATIRAGVLILNLLLALAALINLMNIISTGIANRRSELASLQCIGMTDRQLDGMAVIECLQFAGAAAVISAVICAVVIFGSELGLTAFINASFVDESEEIRKMLTNLIRFDHITPFVRIVLAALTAFAAGCVTSLVMLRAQNSDSLSDQMRGTEMQPDTKKSHLLRNSVIAVVSAFVLVISGLRIYSICAYRHDRNEYAKAGYLNLVESNGFKMNVYSTGAEHGKHTIVGLAGMGVHCYPVTTQALNERLGKENTLVYPDRAGYGFSDDSYKSQTLGQVVEDYRTGLQNAGFQPPYVLMPHSYSSYYALWWQEKYPEEIEAIVFMDCTEVMENECWEKWTVDAYPSRSAAYADARRAVTRTWLGLDRLIDYYGQGTAESSSYGRSVLTQEQLDLWDLTEQRIWSAASVSDLANEQDAANEVRKLLRPTDIPKLYFCTTPTCEEDIREHLEIQNADVLAAGKEPKLDPETAAKAEWQRDGWACQDYYANTLTPFLEQCGNCRLVCVGCDHGLFYAQKPQQVADEILALLAELE